MMKEALFVCGHVGIPWPVIKTLGSMVKDGYCKTCDRWVEIVRQATLMEAAGLQELPLADPDAETPPF